jgi:hypothetical protein
MINKSLISVGFILVLVLSGVDLWGSDGWFIGLALGAAVGIAWCVERKIGLVLGVVGFVMLIIGIFGFADGFPKESRALFNGMALGGMVGMAVYVAIRWKVIKPVLLKIASYEECGWLIALLEPTKKK